MRILNKSKAVLFILGYLLILQLENTLLAQSSNMVFESISGKKSGVTFKNQLKEDTNNNILRYEYFYNGAGVAVGDLNNDGLEDIFFTGNMVPNKMYKNLGNFKFEDKTKFSGISGKNSWTTGVTMADVNGDGLLDIYVSYSGKGDADSRRNELWINRGGFKFQNEAEAYGLNDSGNSTQALFFDFDKDGDLDMYLLNHHIESIHEMEFSEVKSIRHPTAGDKLFRNDGEKFIDISQQAGIKGSALGFGLSVVSSDINKDGWPDLLVTNDYIEPDYLYINNGDGTFTDQLTEHFQHISHFSMGADIADINNDGKPDIYTLDMLPEDNARQKLLYGPENYEQYALMIQEGFYHQNMRNMLQVSLGDGFFSEVGQMAGISNTDWSWSALFFDANNDGQKDLFVTNGYFRDYTNRDFLKYKGDYYFKQAIAAEKADTLHLVTSMASTPIHNYIFENNGNLKFSDRSGEWGFSEKNFSSGAAYADLDNDGDLDLIINNLNALAGIYENKLNAVNYLQIQLYQEDQNKFAIGAKVEIYDGQTRQFAEIQPVRGFQSSVSTRLHFGLSDHNKATSVEITWPDGSFQVLEDVKANQLLKITKENTGQPTEASKPSPIFKRSANSPTFVSQSAGFNDLKRQPLMINMPSYISPILAQGDLNGDGIAEVFIGGTKGQAAKIFTLSNKEWIPYHGFISSEEFTDAVAIFKDFDQDGTQDLFVGSGGYHDYLASDEGLQDRLYLNDGSGQLTRAANFPSYTLSTGDAVAIDANGDGALDLFIGARLIPGKYPLIPQSKILINDGAGNFSDQSATYLPKSGEPGLVTGVEKIDLNGDGLDDLVIVGEFMPITFWVNQGGKSFEDQTSVFLDKTHAGWWGSIHSADMDGDGDLDLIVGNYGLNTQFKANENRPIKLYAADFDKNGSIDPIYECYLGDSAFPYASRDELLDQMAGMRSKFTDYASYSNAKIEDLFTVQQLEEAQVLVANSLESIYLENTGSGFKARPLPSEAQAFPIYAIQSLDVNADGNMDLILGGNQTFTRIRIGVIDAGFGLVMLGDGKGTFRPLSPSESGIGIKGDIKSILYLQSSGESSVLFGIHNQQIQQYDIK
ncbi:VCBS repeat-containing protein [Algoriphagus resistens]|uniref:VCBS repeat-containing protein n=1 Tax=Algoriphagus resistens TaxID=1750590 RepID=UPI000716AB8F|nr:VCBS repeat-containing protein [Algoriphagus resistens]